MSTKLTTTTWSCRLLSTVTFLSIETSFHWMVQNTSNGRLNVSDGADMTSDNHNLRRKEGAMSSWF